MNILNPPGSRAFRFSFAAAGHSACQRAFSLVEVTIAMGIASCCLVTVVGLLPVGLTSNKNSIEQSAAASLARAIVADLRLTPKSASQSPQFAISLSAATSPMYFAEDGTKQPSASSARYLATVTINNSSPSVTLVNTRVTWPAAASAASPSGAFESVTAIDRR